MQCATAADHRFFCAILVATFTIVSPSAVNAQQPKGQPSYADLEKRVRELEAIVHRQKAEPAEPAAASSGAGTDQEKVPAPMPVETFPETTKVLAVDPQEGGPRQFPVLAGWDEGFYLKSADDQFHLRVTGQIQADYRAYVDGVDFTDIDNFFIRRARLGIEANMFKYYEFRLLPDFGQGQARVQDAYLNVHYWDAFQVEAGKFKQPVSYEQLIQDRFVPTLERSLIDQLVPSRDEGVMIHGQKLFGDRFDWAAAVSNGEINGDGDTNDLKDLSGRIAIRPLNSDRIWPVFHLLQIGISGSTGKEQEPINPNTLRTPAGVRYFQFNPSVRADGLRNRWSPELSYFYGPLGFAAQYYRRDQDLRPNFTGPTFKNEVDVPFKGWYFLGTYLLTGEERTTYSEAVTPLRNFNPCHPLSCGGAWELAARVSELMVGDVVFAPGPARLADPSLFTNRVTELTAGFNWYLNKWVRTQFNWEHAWFASPVRLGPGPSGLLRHQDSLEARFQIIF